MCRGRGGCITLSFAANVDVVSLSASAAAPAAATAAVLCHLVLAGGLALRVGVFYRNGGTRNLTTGQDSNAGHVWLGVSRNENDQMTLARDGTTTYQGLTSKPLDP